LICEENDPHRRGDRAKIKRRSLVKKDRRPLTDPGGTSEKGRAGRKKRKSNKKRPKGNSGGRRKGIYLHVEKGTLRGESSSKPNGGILRPQKKKKKMRMKKGKNLIT